MGQSLLRVAIAGATGYTGAELIRYLVQHPRVTITGVTSEQSAGERLDTRLPFLRGVCPLTCEKLNAAQLAEKADLIFVALGHTQGMAAVPSWMNTGKQVIDLSADFRLQSPSLYEAWYKTTHLAPDLINKAVYGLPEIYRDRIIARSTESKNRLIANPGCYPTGALLPLYPFLKADVVDTTREIVIDAKSGVSGAGRAATDSTHFPQVNEGLTAYNIGTHRHLPEIEQAIAPFGANVLFTPYLLPITRGILTTIYLPLKSTHTQDALEAILETSYKHEPFIRLTHASPNLNDVKGSNFCDIAVFQTARSKTAILISAIDNLGKGAAGQAVQNMNILMGWDEQEGLRAPGFFP